MAKLSLMIFFAFTLIPILCNASPNNVEDMKIYIVYMGSLPEESSYSPTSHHLRMLQQVTKESDAKSPLLIRSFQRSFNGFAAKLTEQQREKIAQMEEVVSIFPSKTLKTHTTRSWDFMGFVESSKRNVAGESDVIIGFIDSGIWPEAESFTDKGFSPPPKKWKGKCAGGKNFTCNNKIIGARFYDYEDDSARDNLGHGTLTASTAAGNKVNGVSFYGLAEGTARGGVPSARIAVYKACDNQGDFDYASFLAAFDDAIADGVDIISVSLSVIESLESLYDDDVISIGSFHAMAKGILTVQSAGNDGPVPSQMTSIAPWILTVGASTIDRKIIDKIVLGNGMTLVGDYSLNAFDLNGTKYPINKCFGSPFCKQAVKGTIVLSDDDTVIHDACEGGAVGGVLKDDEFDTQEQFTPTYFPYLTLSSKDFDVAKSYTNSTERPEAKIMKSEEIVDNTAPKIARFSSRGPCRVVSEIMKPDISAPGVHILAAFSPSQPPSYDSSQVDTRRVNYSIVAGTSIACPHVSGIAAYVKSFHPDWSPAAIKSAIMTTAKPMNGPKNQQIGDENEFAYGSGHLNPLQAIDPGLVYDLTKQDYLEFLCNLGYNASMIQKISKDQNITCPSADRSLIRNANFPSILVEVPSMKPFDVEVNRTLTNVGVAKSEYKVTVKSAPRVNITIEPKLLSFKSLNEKQSFVVKLMGGKLPEGTVSSSSLVWSDGTHNVRSPIVVNVLNLTKPG